MRRSWEATSEAWPFATRIAYKAVPFYKRRGHTSVVPFQDKVGALDVRMRNSHAEIVIREGIENGIIRRI